MSSYAPENRKRFLDVTGRDEGFSSIFERANELAGVPVNFRTFAIEFCDLMAERAPRGVSWQHANHQVSAYVADPVLGLTDQQVVEAWHQAYRPLDLEALAKRHPWADPEDPATLQPAPPAGLDDRLRGWYEAAVLDGWEVFVGGPWAPQVSGGPHDPTTRQIVQRLKGHDEHDLSTVLRKGDAVVWLVDRMIGPAGRELRQVYTAGWFDNGQTAFEVPHAYDAEQLTLLRGACLDCKAHVGRENLQHVGFAGVYCDDCAPAQRRKQEFPGWCD